MTTLRLVSESVTIKINGVEFKGFVQVEHVRTKPAKPHPSEHPCASPLALEPPCTCVDLMERALLSDGCAKHDGRAAKGAWEVRR